MSSPGASCRSGTGSSQGLVTGPSRATQPQGCRRDPFSGCVGPPCGLWLAVLTLSSCAPVASRQSLSTFRRKLQTCTCPGSHTPGPHSRLHQAPWPLTGSGASGRAAPAVPAASVLCGAAGSGLGRSPPAACLRGLLLRPVLCFTTGVRLSR